MNKTKVIVTIGPDSEDIDTIRKLIVNGADVIRLNMNHCTIKFCDEIIKKIKTINEELGTNITFMIDTKGPEIRIGNIANNKAILKDEDKIRIYTTDILGDSTKFSINYEKIVEDA